MDYGGSRQVHRATILRFELGEPDAGDIHKGSPETVIHFVEKQPENNEF
jgi:hypothetical protein